MGNIKNTSSIKTVLYPVVSKRMDSKITAFRSLVGRYISKHYEELYANAPYDRITFGAFETEDLYNTLGRDLEAVATKAVSGTYYSHIANYNPLAAKDETTLILLCIVRYFINKKNDKDTELAAIYLAFSGKMYPSTHYNSFPKVTPSEYRYVMEYVINHELSKKYDIVREGSVFGAIKSLCNTWLNTYTDQFKSFDDGDVSDVIQQLRDRIKSFITNIATVYYEVYKDRTNLYLSYDSDSYEEDSFRIADNDSLKAERFTEITMNYIATSEVNYKFCNMVSDNNVHFDEAKFIIESIQSVAENMPLIKELIGIVIVLYFSISEDKDVRTIDFVSKSTAAKPNSKNKDYIRLKEIIYGFLEKYSSEYRRRKKREPTKNSYFNVVLKYYVLVINVANK